MSMRQCPLRALSRAIAKPFCSAAEAATFPLKNVTTSNFESSFEALRDHVRAADFVAIDLEMTGVSSAPWRDSFEIDRTDVTYLKVKDSAEKFAVVQFGVCPFRWDSSKQSFIAHPHNFFVFPRRELPADGPCYEFLCQTSSLGFLAKYQFDFNACILEGVSYLSRAQEDEALTRLNTTYQDESLLSQSNYNRTLTMADILFTQRMKNRFSEWRDELLTKGKEGYEFSNSSGDSEQKFQTVIYKNHPAMILDGFTSHQLGLIQLVIGKNFKDLAYVRTNNKRSVLQYLVVRTNSEDDKNLLMKEVRDEKYKAAETGIQAAVGFRHVIDLLSSENKLVVGHNCILDIAQIYSKFIGPLPFTTDDFISTVNKYFPHIIDTKILLNVNIDLQNRMKKSSTSLSSAFALLCPEIALRSEGSGLASEPCVKVEVQVDALRSSKWNSGAKHEAGYDAFMTGCIFAQACSHLGIDFKGQSRLADNKVLEKYINHLYLSWRNDDIIDISSSRTTVVPLGSSILRKRRPKIAFESVLLIWGFPSKLKASEIKDCITRVFGPLSVTSVYLLDESSIFVQFSEAELVSSFLLLKQTLEEQKDPISVSHPLSKLLDGGITCAAGYNTYKEICSSPVSKFLFADQAAAVGINWKTKTGEVLKSNRDEMTGEVNIELCSEENYEGKSDMFIS